MRNGNLGKGDEFSRVFRIQETKSRFFLTADDGNMGKIDGLGATKRRLSKDDQGENNVNIGFCLRCISRNFSQQLIIKYKMKNRIL